MRSLVFALPLALILACGSDPTGGPTMPEGHSGGSTGGAGSSGGSPQTGGSTGGATGGVGGATGGATGGTSGGSTGGATGGATGGSVGGTTGGATGGNTNGPATITDGDEARVLLAGTILSPDQVIDGQVLVESGKITCVAEGTVCAARASGATRVETRGVIIPGLVDMHNHILFDIFNADDWTPTKKYANHNQWPNEARYGAMLDIKQCLADDSQGKPTWCPAKFDGAGSLLCEMNKWGELKGLIAGTTSIVGLPGRASKCFSSISRSIDTAHSGLGVDKIQTNVGFPPSPTSADGVCANFADHDTSAYLTHCGEGIDETARREFDTLGTVTTTDQCLYAPQTVITHGTGFGEAEFKTMGEKGMRLTWSPASNVFLYGATTNIPLALKHNVLVSIGPDWSMGGSQNMLDELRFADAWDDKNWGNILSPKMLLEMSTTNAAASLGLANRIGRIAVGYEADLVVLDPPATGADAYTAVLAATPKEVRLVMVGGRVAYGDSALAAAGPAKPGCESVSICGREKFLCAALESTADKLAQTRTDIESTLNSALVELDQLVPGGYKFAPVAPLIACKP